MSDDDGINVRIRSFSTAPLRARIGETTFEFPPGTSREDADAVIEEAKKRYFRELGLIYFPRKR